MPWKKLSSWYASVPKSGFDYSMALTLVTLIGCKDAPVDEIDFYADAEFDALVKWAETGRFVMAFAALERDELTLVCTDSADTMRARVSDLPLISAGLAIADIRQVASLRLGRKPLQVN